MSLCQTRHAVTTTQIIMAATQTISQPAVAASFRPSLIELYLTNLRLLDLDRRPDWPSITARTYATKDAQNQKQRILCTEWALFRLFELWSPDETQYVSSAVVYLCLADPLQKLQPFFPPLEPLQSLNLRAALFRMLSELKKSGVLGRETVLRKTMLDDCKGDKFMEVLVVFSSAVVKQVMLRKNMGQYQRPPVSMALASSALRSARDRASLVPLMLAHRAAIGAFLRLKSETHSRCQSFSQLLDQKTDQLKFRMGQCHDSEWAMPPEVRRRIEREVVENWPGSNKWPQVLLYGDHTDPGDQPLRRPFDDVWDVVANGGALLPDTATLGLIDNLERRVNEQKERLVKWRDFHDVFLQRLRSQGSDQSSLPQSSARPAFEFLKHQGLDLNSAETSSPAPILEARNPVLDEIIRDMKTELDNVSVPKVKRRTEAKHETSRTVAASTAGAQEPSRRDAARPARTRQQPLFKARLLSANVSGMYKPGGNSMAFGQIFSPAKPQAEKVKPAEVPSFLLSAPGPVNGHDATRLANPEQSVNQVSNGHDSYLHNGYGGADMVQPLSNAESLTLLSSRMSLTDRTRMTMGQTSANLQSTGAVQATSEAFSATSVIAAGPSVADRRASLLERTQQSMASAPRGSRMSLAVKKNRQSILYPVNQFETPGRVRAEPIRNATPTETLFSEDADYASVFKSRPRVKLSPVGTPAEDEMPSPASQGTVYDIDDTLDDDDSWMRSSPLRGKG
jgi:hypothetical protein